MTMTKEELDATIPPGLLRAKRNCLLAETDWWASTDITMSTEHIVYRQALRDLPSTQTAVIDSFGGITGVTYPTKPSDPKIEAASDE